jgi:beta-galactosidase GanA
MYVDFISPDDIRQGNLYKYRLLYLHSSFLIPEEIAEKIKGYVKNGGVAYAEAGCATRDATGEDYPFIPGAGLRDLFGCYQKQLYKRSDRRTSYRLLLKEKETVKLWAVGYRQNLKIEKGEVLAEFSEGGPALVKTIYGKGKAYYAASSLSRGYIFYPDNQQAKKLILRVAREAGVEQGVSFTRMRRRGVKMSLLQADKEKLLILINYESRRVPITAVLPCSGKLRAVIPGYKFSWKALRKGIKITTSLKPDQVQVYLISERQ